MAVVFQVYRDIGDERILIGEFISFEDAGRFTERDKAAHREAIGYDIIRVEADNGAETN